MGTLGSDRNFSSFEDLVIGVDVDRKLSVVLRLENEGKSDSKDSFLAGLGLSDSGVLEVLEALVDKDGLGLSQDASGMVQGPVRGRGGGAGRMEKATKGKERQ